MKLKITVNSIEYEVEVEVLDEGVFKNNLTIPLLNSKQHQKQELQHKPHASSHNGGQNCRPAAKTFNSHRLPRPIATSDQGLHAPVVGTILDIFCKEGQYLKYGEPILVLEAMKMQNTLIAEKDGKVVRINVSKGESVKEGQLLVEYS